MKISTKVGCGIIAIADIALNSENSETVTVYSIADRRALSCKYLEQVLSALRHAKLIKGIKGSRGGYILAKSADEITLKEIIDALDPCVLGSDVAMVNAENKQLSEVLDEVLWSRFERELNGLAKNITLKNFIQRYSEETLEKNAEPMYYI